MKKDKRYFLTGLFVLSGFLLFTLGCILFGSGELFAKKLYFETYFASSVQGLDVGSPVKFRGVTMGKVEEISFSVNTYRNDPNVQAQKASREMAYSMMYVRVVCSINLKEHPNYTEEQLKNMVKRGMHTSLASQGITGIAFINLDYYRDDKSEKDLKFAWTPKEIYVPSTPTVLQTIVDVVEDISEELKNVQLAEAVKSINTLAINIDKNVTAADFPKLTATFNALGESLTKQSQALEVAVDKLKVDEFANNVNLLTKNLAETSETLRNAMPKLSEHTDKTLGTIEEALDQLKTTLSTVNETIQDVKVGMDFGEIGDETNNTLNSLSRAAASLEALIDEVREKPSRLFFDDAE